jgi:histone-lysine N-methyltransferase SETMAR
LDKWVPNELNQNHLHRRLEVASSLLIRQLNDPFIDRIVSCDDKWILYDNRHRTGQWLDVDEPPKHFAKPEMHQKKVMVSVLWNARSVIHYSILKPGETITAERYC